MLSLEQKKFALEQWFSMHSITAVRKSFRTYLGIKCEGTALPSTSSLWNVIKTSDRFGTFCDRWQGKEPLSERCDVQRVEHLYSRKQKILLRVSCRKLDISAYRTSNVVRSRLLTPKFALRLTESQRKARISVCKAFPSKKACLIFR